MCGRNAKADSWEHKVRFFRIHPECVNGSECFRSSSSIVRTVQFPTRSHMNLGGLPYNRLRA